MSARPSVYVPTAMPPVDWAEVGRYARADAACAQACTDAACVLEAVSARVSFLRLPVVRDGGKIALGPVCCTSRTLSRALDGCDEALLLVASVGAEVDRAVRRLSVISEAAALIGSAIGGERVEALLDLFVRQMDERLCPEGLRLRPRVSPGYGDLPLSLQSGVLGALDAARTVGVTLSASLLMSPMKSVSAIAGIGPF